ncbi:hypothetical protein PVAND_000862 [Polypedilum vanderplanki]|uniref:Uncharacterized protein n=1 Tax=Polypedilum vanderplanki TaxID=319348 RepID=A0A9J6BLH5_POLVA|nr:hypothetical protein PVAND_000862 [Polypedilum vanderplanki]
MIRGVFLITFVFLALFCIDQSTAQANKTVATTAAPYSVASSKNVTTAATMSSTLLSTIAPKNENHNKTLSSDNKKENSENSTKKTKNTRKTKSTKARNASKKENYNSTQVTTEKTLTKH